MKKEKGFLSFIEDLKSEIDDVKSQINEMGSDFKGGNTFKTSSKPKNKNSSKNNKKQSYRINNFEDYGTTSIEGKSIMNTSMEGQGQMYNSRKTERVALRNDIQHFDELIERKTKKFVIKGKESLSKAILYSEIIGKPKSLK